MTSPTTHTKSDVRPALAQLLDPKKGFAALPED